MNVRHPHPMVVALLLAFAPGCTPIDTPATQPSTPPAAPDPLVFDTWVPGPCSPNGQAQGNCPPGDLFRVRLTPIAEGLMSPRHMAFTPNGDLLITELAEPPGDPATGNQAVQGRQGRVRIVRNGVLAAEPLVGWPTPSIEAGALQSVIVHPQFAANGFVYLYYIKKRDEMSSRALARARLEGNTLRDVQEIFEADSWIPGGPMAGRAAFGPDGTIYLTVNDHVEHDGRDNGNVRRP